MELWDVYDADRRLTGRTMVRGERFQPGDYHLVVHICIRNSAGEMLIQRRQPFKQGFPGMWDVSVGGSAVAGDTSARAAEREVEEELGLTLHLQGRTPHLSLNFNEGYDDFYIVDQDVDLSALHLQESEVAEVRWASKAEILELIRDGSFIPYHESLIGLLFDLEQIPDSHQGRINGRDRTAGQKREEEV